MLILVNGVESLSLILEIELALKKGVQPRVEIGSFEQAKEYIDMGVRHFCIGFDLTVFYQWCRQQAEGMQELIANI